MEKLLEVEDLTKTFTLGSVLSRVKITAVDDISFYIKPAEIFALAGESGCGKTTTARIIMGFDHASAGTIIHGGKKEAKNEKVWFTEGIQAIFQDPFGTFNPLREVERYFFETIQNYKLAKSKQEAIARIDAKLRLVGLTYEDLAGKYPSEFSGGQLQRISIARALLTDPKLIIADEPVSMVDASLRMSIVNLFKKLRDELGVSVLYITHDLATAYYVCDRIAQASLLGELHHALDAGLVDASAQIAELGQIIAGQALGRASAQEVTICDLTGTGAQDTAIANLAHARALSSGRGTTFRS